jgi:hypothetical protein
MLLAPRRAPLLLSEPSANPYLGQRHALLHLTTPECYFGGSTRAYVTSY